MHCREDHQTHDDKPMGCGSVELELPRTAYHLCGAGAIAHESERVDEVAEIHALVGRTQVVVEPGQNKQHHRLVGTTEVLRSKAYGWDRCQQKATRLQRCESLRGKRAPGFVDEVLLDGIRETLIGNAEDEEVQPDPNEDVREAEDGGGQPWRWVGRKERAGQSAEDAESGFGVYHGYEIAASEEPDGVEMEG